MLRALGWIVWGCIAWMDSHMLLPIRQTWRRLAFGKRIARRRARTAELRASRRKRLIGRARSWAKCHENADIREFRQTIAGRGNFAPRTPASILSVYETLRLYVLADRWTPFVEQAHWLFTFTATLECLALSLLMAVLLAFGPVGWRIQDGWPMLLGALFVALLGLLALRPIWRQLESSRRMWLLCIVVVVHFLWWLRMFSSPEGQALGLLEFALLNLLGLGGVLATIAGLAYLMEWKLLAIWHAMMVWAMVNVSTQYKQEQVNTLAAWLLLLAPTQEGPMGWRAHERISLLQETCAAEREGAEWRSIILSIVTLFGISNLGDILALVQRAQDLDYGFARRLAVALNVLNPTIMIVALWGAGILVSVVLEIWLAEVPNRLISLACVRAHQVLADTEGNVGRSFEDYRMITTANPDSLEPTTDARWTVIDKRRIDDGQWRCLVQSRSWSVTDDEDAD